MYARKFLGYYQYLPSSVLPRLVPSEHDNGSLSPSELQRLSYIGYPRAAALALCRYLSITRTHGVTRACVCLRVNIQYVSCENTINNMSVFYVLNVHKYSSCINSISSKSPSVSILVLIVTYCSWLVRVTALN